MGRVHVNSAQGVTGLLDFCCRSMLRTRGVRATVVTRSQSRRSADEKEEERTSPPVQDSELEHSTGRQGGAVVDPPVDCGRAADPSLGDTPHHNLLLDDGVGWTLEELQKLQADDRDIGPVVVWLEPVSYTHLTLPTIYSV